MEKTKKEKGHIILITVLVVLLLIVFLAFGYFLGGANIINDVRENNTMKTGEIVTSEEKASAKDFDKEEAKKILEDFGFYRSITCSKAIYDFEYSENYKMIVAAEKVSNVKEVSCNEIYSESSHDQIGYKGETGYCLDNTKLITYADLNKVYNKMYGKDVPKKSINRMGYIFTSYDYISDKEVFSLLQCGGCGGTCGPNGFNINEVKSAKVIGDYLYVDVNYYYSSPTENDIYLVTGKTTIGLGTKDYTAAEKIIREKYMDYLDTYEVVFRIVDNDYQFVSVSKLLS